MPILDRRPLLLAAAVLVGCDASPGPNEGPGDGTRAGDVLSSPPYPTWAVDSASALRIGAGVQGDEERQFSDIRYAATLSDDRVVVVDGASAEVRWFGEDGAFDGRAGGRGEGPGELSRVEGGTVLSGDTLVLFDSRNGRLTWFDPNGALADTRPLDLGLSLGVTLHDLGGGRLLVAVESPNHNFGGAEYNYARDSVFAAVVSDAARADTVLRLPGKEAVTWVDYVDGRPAGTRQMELPFGRGTLVGGLDGAIVAVRSGEGRLDFFGVDGGALHSARRSDLDPQPVSSGLRQRYVESEAERVVALGLPAEMARRGAEERLALLPEGRTVPAYDRMLIDRVGERIWLRDFMPAWSRDDPRPWTVHDERGRVLARLTTPAGFDLMHVAEDRLTGVVRDAMGVESVTVHRLRP